MLAVSTTQFRSRMFDYLGKVAAGETVVLLKSKKEVARLVPPYHHNWREKMPCNPQLKVSATQLMAPLDEEWDVYQ